MFALFVKPLDGPPRRVSEPASDVAGFAFQHASWSPDGQRLTYTTGGQNEHAIAVAAADGRGERRLTSGADDDLWPVWSNDGRRIAFTSGGQLRWPIATAVVIDSDGSHQHELAAEGLIPFPVSWSPDDRHIFGFGQPGTLGANTIVIMSVDGGEHPQIVNAPYNAGTSTWQRLAP